MGPDGHQSSEAEGSAGLASHAPGAASSRTVADGGPADPGRVADGDPFAHLSGPMAPTGPGSDEDRAGRPHPLDRPSAPGRHEPPHAAGPAATRAMPPPRRRPGLAGLPAPSSPDDRAEGQAEPLSEPRRRLIERLRRPPRVRRKLSDILSDLAGEPSRDRISVADLIAAVGGARAFGALLLVFALPNALPAIPGTSGILGLPLLFLTFQLMLGRPPWLPQFVTNRSLAREDFGKLVARINPWLTWADRLTAPRLSWLVSPASERLSGLLALVFAILVALPIPLGNMLPATAICMIALGLLERDGLWVLLGWVTGALAVVIVSGVVWAMATATLLFLRTQFGIG